eukprot:TRINITY_DN74661_c0_g1_i1.p1 TRINITY_DN74661_c0_g1~~TRINITY_DN74661_c0_g1_i1.p1  ORF type:complete len:617 (-),score=114.32 TRINITY_DN74661_c0_g1_i1:323-2173(-)
MAGTRAEVWKVDVEHATEFWVKNTYAESFSLSVNIFDGDDRKLGVAIISRDTSSVVAKVTRKRRKFGVSLCLGFGSLQFIPGGVAGDKLKLRATGAAEDDKCFDEWTLDVSDGGNGDVTANTSSSKPERPQQTTVSIEVQTRAGYNVFGPEDVALLSTIETLKAQISAKVGYEVPGLQYGKIKLYNPETLSACRLGNPCVLQLTPHAFAELSKDCADSLKELKVMSELHGDPCIRIRRSCGKHFARNGEDGDSHEAMGSGDDVAEIVLLHDGVVLGKRQRYLGMVDKDGQWVSASCYELAEGTFDITDPATCGIKLTWTSVGVKIDQETRADAYSKDKGDVDDGEWEEQGVEEGALMWGHLMGESSSDEVNILEVAKKWLEVGPPRGFKLPGISQEVIGWLGVHPQYTQFFSDNEQAPHSEPAVRERRGLQTMGLALDHLQTTALGAGFSKRAEVPPMQADVTYTPLAAWRAGSSAGPRGVIAERVGAKFRMLDLNNDGSISFDELYKVLNKINEDTWTKQKVQQLMTACDVNRDGRIQYEELVDWMFGDDESLDEFKGTMNVGAKSSVSYWASVYEEDVGQPPANASQLFLFASGRGAKVFHGAAKMWFAENRRD